MRTAFVCGGIVGGLIGAVLLIHATPAYGRWPEEIRQLMHRSCMVGATDDAKVGTRAAERACWCLVRRVEAKYTVAEFAAIAEATDGEVPQLFRKLALDCALEATMAR